MVPAGGLCIFPLWLAALQLMQLIGLHWRCGQLIIWFGDIKHVQSSNMCTHAIKSDSSGSEISNMFLAIVYQCLPFLSVKSQNPRISWVVPMKFGHLHGTWDEQLITKKNCTRQASKTRTILAQKLTAKQSDDRVFGAGCNYLK